MGVDGLSFLCNSLPPTPPTHRLWPDAATKGRGQSRPKHGPLASPGSLVPHWAVGPRQAPLAVVPGASIGRLIKDSAPPVKFLPCAVAPVITHPWSPRRSSLHPPPSWSA